MHEYMNINQYGWLYDNLVPSLYQAAFYFTGDKNTAADAIESVWLHMMLEKNIKDERVLRIHMARELVDYCHEKFKKSDSHLIYSDRSEVLLQYLDTISFEKRCVFILGIILDYSVSEISIILQCSKWTVVKRLKDILKDETLKMHLQERKFNKILK